MGPAREEHWGREGPENGETRLVGVKTSRDHGTHKFASTPEFVPFFGFFCFL